MPRQRTMSLPCPLSDAEVLLKAADLATTLVDVERAEEVLKSLRADQKAKVKKARARLKDLARAVASRSEPRDVDVFEDADPGAGLVWTVRRDTGARVESRPMEADDRQLELVPGKVLALVGADDARSGERASERTNDRASERARVRAPTCACDHAPIAHHDADEHQESWGACGITGCRCQGSGDVADPPAGMGEDVAADLDDGMAF